VGISKDCPIFLKYALLSVTRDAHLSNSSFIRSLDGGISVTDSRIRDDQIIIITAQRW